MKQKTNQTNYSLAVFTAVCEGVRVSVKVSVASMCAVNVLPFLLLCTSIGVYSTFP